jgi:alanine dehydrogenase
MKIRLLSEKDIRSVAPSLPEAVALVEEAYRLDAEGQVDVPTKIGVHPDRANSFLHAMPAWVNGARALGMKWVSYFPGNFDRGLPDSTGIIILNDSEHGLPCCIMEGMYVTFLRTAACAAVAAKYLAPRPPKRSVRSLRGNGAGESECRGRAVGRSVQ